MIKAGSIRGAENIAYVELSKMSAWAKEDKADLRNKNKK